MTEPWDIKLARADEHLVELRRSIRVMEASGDFGAVTDETGRERAVRLVLRAEIPPRMSAIVGDIIHNARSSLDTIAFAVCESGKGSPLPEQEEQDVQFPITDHPSWFDKAVPRRLPHAATECIEFILSHQPWHWVNQASVLDDAQRKESIRHEELSTLQRLSNIDKHRTVHLTACHPTDVYAGSNEGLNVGWRPNHPRRPWENGDVIGWWVLEGTDQQIEDFWPKAEVGQSLQCHLDLNWPGIAVDQFLESLLRYVDSVVVPLARMIGRATR